MARALTLGDVLQVECSCGTGYVSYAGRHPRFGDTIWVVPHIFAEPASNWSDLFVGEGYFAFYPAHTAVRQRLVRKVGFAPEAVRLLPQYWRNAVGFDEPGPIKTWLITDGTQRTSREESALSQEERLLPIASIWNHELLCERLASGWTPLHGGMTT